MLHNSLDSKRMYQKTQPDQTQLSSESSISLGQKVLSDLEYSYWESDSYKKMTPFKEKLADYLQKSGTHAFRFAQAIMNLKKSNLLTENNIDDLFRNIQHADAIYTILTIFLNNSLVIDQDNYDAIIKYAEYSAEIREMIQMVSLVHCLSQGNIDGVMNYRSHLKEIMKNIEMTHVISTDNINQAVETINQSLVKDGKPLPPRSTHINAKTLPGFFKHPSGYQQISSSEEEPHKLKLK